MLDGFYVVHKGGAVLFSSGDELRGAPHPVDDLICNVLLEERSSDTAHIKDAYAMMWCFANDLDLVFVAVYQKQLRLPHVPDLLASVKAHVCGRFRDEVARLEELPIADAFDAILTECEQRAKTKRATTQPRPFQKKSDQPTTKKAAAAAAAAAAPAPVSVDDLAVEQSLVPEGTYGTETEAEKKARIAANIAKFKKNQAAKKEPGKKGSPAPASPQKRGKIMAERTKLTAKDLDASNSSRDEDAEVEAFRKQFGGPGGVTEIEYEESYSDDEDDDDTDGAAASSASKVASGWMSWVQSMTGNKPFDRQDLEPIMAKLKEQLIAKNVAEETADTLCESVAASLIGKKPASTFSGAKSAFREAMEKALTRVLTPKRNIDVLRGIEQAKQAKRPYVIVFCGVNGVGKSTNLAKVCKWIVGNGYSVMMAACDTFRSGAVEQLRVHSRCLEVPIFERGYGKDPAGIAKEGIAQAKQQGRDVVLVDTAGRMQDNEPLMRALAKLVHVNNPDLVLFVGEALVGNDGVDQLSGFNKAMVDFAPATATPRQIDGILLTKFDTIDDKVGAAVSMVTALGQPIIFVGTGQTYNDLKKMNVRTVVKALLK